MGRFCEHYASGTARYFDSMEVEKVLCPLAKNCKYGLGELVNIGIGEIGICSSDGIIDSPEIRAANDNLSNIVELKLDSNKSSNPL